MNCLGRLGEIVKAPAGGWPDEERRGFLFVVDRPADLDRIGLAPEAGSLEVDEDDGAILKGELYGRR